MRRGVPKQPTHSHVLFGAEKEEDDDESSTDEDEPQPQSSSTINFSWSKFHQAAKASFAKRVSEVGKPPQKKRPYNNDARAARAAYGRKSGCFKENGKDSARISSVLSCDNCLCSFA